MTLVPFGRVLNTKHWPVNVAHPEVSAPSIREKPNFRVDDNTFPILPNHFNKGRLWKSCAASGDFELVNAGQGPAIPVTCRHALSPGPIPRPAQ